MWIILIFNLRVSWQANTIVGKYDLPDEGIPSLHLAAVKHVRGSHRFQEILCLLHSVLNLFTNTQENENIDIRFNYNLYYVCYVKL